MAKQPTPIRIEWRGGRTFRASPVVAHNTIEMIRKVTGTVTPAALVDASRSEDAPLHEEFEWDDNTAAEGFRRGQARQILNHLLVVYRSDTSKESRPTRAYVAMRSVAAEARTEDDDKTEGYTDVQTIMQNPQLRRRYIVSVLREIAAWRRRHADIVELSNLFAAIDPVLLEYGVEVERIQLTA